MAFEFKHCMRPLIHLLAAAGIGYMQMQIADFSLGQDLWDYQFMTSTL